MGITIPILLYHSISEDSAPNFQKWAVRPEAFAAHLAYLQMQGYTSMTVTDLVRTTNNRLMSLPDRPIVITFDDGFLDFYTDAFPALQNYSFAATLYITTGYVGRTSRWLAQEGEGNRPMLNWHQIKKISAGKVECGAHTHTHPQLDIVPIREARQEIFCSKTILEQQLGQPVTTFAYPHGYYNSWVRQAVHEAGFSSACAVKHAMSNDEDDQFALRRIIVTRDTDVQSLDNWLNGNNLRDVPAKEQLRTKGWRLVRWSQKVLKDAFNPEVVHENTEHSGH